MTHRNWIMTAAVVARAPRDRGTVLLRAKHDLRNISWTPIPWRAEVDVGQLEPILSMSI